MQGRRGRVTWAGRLPCGGRPRPQGRRWGSGSGPAEARRPKQPRRRAPADIRGPRAPTSPRLSFERAGLGSPLAAPSADSRTNRVPGPSFLQTGPRPPAPSQVDDLRAAGEPPARPAWGPDGPRVTAPTSSVPRRETAFPFRLAPLGSGSSALAERRRSSSFRRSQRRRGRRPSRASYRWEPKRARSESTGEGRATVAPRVRRLPRPCFASSPILSWRLDGGSLRTRDWTCPFHKRRRGPAGVFESLPQEATLAPEWPRGDTPIWTGTHTPKGRTEVAGHYFRELRMPRRLLLWEIRERRRRPKSWDPPVNLYHMSLLLLNQATWRFLKERSPNLTCYPFRFLVGRLSCHCFGHLSQTPKIKPLWHPLKLR